MQRLKKGTTAARFLAQKKLKKRHQNACIWGGQEPIKQHTKYAKICHFSLKK
jgi:hypothetical protein